MRCALYARAATRTECDTQLLELRAYVERRGWPPAEEYVDVGTSRPQLAKLMDAAGRLEFEMVLVWRFDRWGRSLPNALKLILDLLGQGIRWIAVSEGIGSHEGCSVSLAQLAVASSEFARVIKSEAVVTGMRKARRN